MSNNASHATGHRLVGRSLCSFYLLLILMASYLTFGLIGYFNGYDIEPLPVLYVAGLLLVVVHASLPKYCQPNTTDALPTGKESKP